MTRKDYYQILGVAKDATQDDIKKAYRKLAMKYHPDHSSGSKESEDRFKEISEAYAVLSDPEKRKQYDTFGSENFQQRYSQEDIFREFDIGDILKEFGFGGASFFTSGGRRGTGRSGAHHTFDPENMFGYTGRSGGRQMQMKGNDIEYEIPLTVQEIASGATKTITLTTPAGKPERLTIKVPKGLITGKKMRLAGKGEANPYGGEPGDLYIRSKVMEDPVFEPKEYDLYINAEIKLSESLLGTRITIPTVDGKQLSLKVAAGTRPKSKLRVAGQGLPYMKGGGKGDLYVVVDIKWPGQLDKKQKELVKQLSETGL